jgi:hypothetical protein
MDSSRASVWSRRPLWVVPWRLAASPCERASQQKKADVRKQEKEIRLQQLQNEKLEVDLIKRRMHIYYTKPVNALEGTATQLIDISSKLIVYIVSESIWSFRNNT